MKEVNQRQIRFGEDNNLLFLNREFIANNLTKSRACEECDKDLVSHEWVVLDDNGFAVDCSNMHSHYIRMDAPVEVRPIDIIPTDKLFEHLHMNEYLGVMVNHVWELRTFDVGDPRLVYARVHPMQHLPVGTPYDYDPNWEYCEYITWRPFHGG